MSQPVFRYKVSLTLGGIAQTIPVLAYSAKDAVQQIVLQHPRAVVSTVEPAETGDARKTVNIQQAQALVGVSRRTIYNWMRDKKIEIVRTAGGNVRIYVDSLWRKA